MHLFLLTGTKNKGYALKKYSFSDSMGKIRGRIYPGDRFLKNKGSMRKETLENCGKEIMKRGL
ncbi:MAG: hypothetical protein FD123_3926 [Bacteroidetes bacterium]|nr:MAG: hypothetical protein FD123_3926 [Bacteroidota bacterium]